jgi:acyl-CoA thioesterase II
MDADLFAPAPTAAANRFTWTPSAQLLTPKSTLQGGAALGAAVAAMERVTGRPTIWATAQYLSFATGTDPVELDVTVEVAGHHTTQARCVVSRDGAEILTTHAALGRRELDIAGVWCAPPPVAEPDACEPYLFFGRGQGRLGDLAEFRLASGRQPSDIDASGGRGDGTFALWVRTWRALQHTVTAPDLTFIGDFMPLAFAEALGEPYAGNSLDNTVRVGELVPTGWVLLACHVQQVTHGFGHGRAELWAQDGTLLGAVSQTAVLRRHARLR